jgi:CheY-like chemotaxis protein
MVSYTQTRLCAPTASVWVVDDDEDDRLIIQSAFKDIDRPISVLTFTDGDQVLPKLVNCDQLPQLILLDINMARLNGFETLLQLRSTPEFSHLSVVMLTTSSEASDRQQSLALGASQCLTKPTSYRQLVALISKLTEQWDSAIVEPGLAESIE